MFLINLIKYLKYFKYFAVISSSSLPSTSKENLPNPKTTYSDTKKVKIFFEGQIQTTQYKNTNKFDRTALLISSKDILKKLLEVVKKIGNLDRQVSFSIQELKNRNNWSTVVFSDSKMFLKKNEISKELTNDQKIEKIPCDSENLEQFLEFRKIIIFNKKVEINNFVYLNYSMPKYEIIFYGQKETIKIELIFDLKDHCTKKLIDKFNKGSVRIFEFTQDGYKKTKSKKFIKKEEIEKFFFNRKNHEIEDLKEVISKVKD